MNEIVLTAKAELHDTELREWFSIMQGQLDKINERTKKHTKEIKELQK